MALEHERETYRKNLPGLLAQRGKYVLIHGDQVDSVWDTQEAALEAGYQRFQLKPFFVKEITESEKPRFFPRNVVPCPTSTDSSPNTDPSSPS